MRAARQLFPSPHRSLSREEAVHLRRLQTASVLTPALLHHMYPDDYPSAQCDICKQGTANRWHILWDCAAIQDGVSFTEYPADLQIAIASTNKSDQEWAIQQVLKALERHGLRKGVPVE